MRFRKKLIQTTFRQIPFGIKYQVYFVYEIYLNRIFRISLGHNGERQANYNALVGIHYLLGKYISKAMFLGNTC